MLPAAHRLRSSTDFSAVTRRGRRARCGSVVAYLLPAEDSPAGRDKLRTMSDQTDQPAQIGLIVGRTVGGSVVRHQVSRRLRAQLALNLDRLPAGSRMVVRALPDTATAPSSQLGADLDAALRRLTASRRR
ncbi:MAG: ribonuclease P protein component [Actinomycetota bacterium]|nr:ribonuclease P protein component [Actinomycetota bacterium]MDQ2955409.1 ribonuclease P protein component [Actinomycetota bacterium]